MKTPNFLFFVLSILILNAVKAQEANPSVSKTVGGGGGFTIGYNYLDVSAFDQFLPENQSLQPNHLSIGGYGNSFIGKFVVGGGGTGMHGSDITTDSLNISAGGGQGTFNVGYLLFKKNNTLLYPLLGIGGGGYSVNIARNNNVPAEEIKDDSFREVDIGTGYFVFDVSLNLNLIPIPQQSDQSLGYGGIMTGLQVGYTSSFSESGFSYSGGNITGASTFRPQMFYVKLVIGGMGFKVEE
jgi:hypothetical protein